MSKRKEKNFLILLLMKLSLLLINETQQKDLL